MKSLYCAVEFRAFKSSTWSSAQINSRLKYNRLVASPTLSDSWYESDEWKLLVCRTWHSIDLAKKIQREALCDLDEDMVLNKADPVRNGLST